MWVIMLEACQQRCDVVTGFALIGCMSRRAAPGGKYVLANRCIGVVVWSQVLQQNLRTSGPPSAPPEKRKRPLAYEEGQW